VTPITDRRLDRHTVGVSTEAPPQVGFLTVLSPQDGEALRALGHRRRYRRGATLFSEGDLSTHVVVILEGRVRVSYTTDAGQEIVFTVREAGDLLGELSAIDGRPRSATASTVGAAEVLVIDGEQFMTFVTTRPAVARLLLRMVSERLRDSDRRQVEFGAFDTVGRVVRRLVALAHSRGTARPDPDGVLLPITQQELAAWTGCSREAVNKALALLRGPGWITTRRGGVLVLDLPALERRSG
jgi:CRP/FNR family transcriptional regulator, cyclic AMP receptor protein